jgi:16S rRNA (guanine527-N7)-methyltransferase
MFVTTVPPSWAVYSAALEGLDLPADFFPCVESYLSALATLNQSLNLISFSTEQELRGHAVDALQVLRTLRAGSSTPLRLIDVGTGGGLPGVPLAIARPLWSVTLLDSLRKKQVAVAGLLETAQMRNGNALWGRAEDLGHQAEHREVYDGALCRAVGRLTTVLELTLPFVKIGGAVYLHRGFEGRTELAESARALKELGGQPGPIYSYRLPGLDKERLILCVEKTHQTSIGFPRRAGIPAKKPL